MFAAAVLWNHYVGRSTASAEAAMAEAVPSAAGGGPAVESCGGPRATNECPSQLPDLASFGDVLRLYGDLMRSDHHRGLW